MLTTQLSSEHLFYFTWQPICLTGGHARKGGGKEKRKQIKAPLHFLVSFLTWYVVVHQRGEPEFCPKLWAAIQHHLTNPGCVSYRKSENVVSWKTSERRRSAYFFVLKMALLETPWALMSEYLWSSYLVIGTLAIYLQGFCAWIRKNPLTRVRPQRDE